MSSVKENIIKIKVLAALIGVNILKNNWRSMNWRIIVSSCWSIKKNVKPAENLFTYVLY